MVKLSHATIPSRLAQPLIPLRSKSDHIKPIQGVQRRRVVIFHIFENICVCFDVDVSDQLHDKEVINCIS